MHVRYISKIIYKEAVVQYVRLSNYFSLENNSIASKCRMECINKNTYTITETNLKNSSNIWIIVHTVLYQLYSPIVTTQSNTTTGNLVVATNFHGQIRIFMNYTEIKKSLQ